jgi:N-acetylglucosaminyldiphosphoundecaprenol N-acetyl-beta-D-mannosaminyltransferase
MRIFNFFGVPVSSFKLDELINFILINSKKRTCKVIYGHSLGIFPRIFLQPETVKYIMDFDAYVSDGHKFHLFGRSLGFPFKHMISLPETTYLALNIANEKKLTVFLLGATLQSNSKAARNIIKQYPNIVYCQGADGYYSINEEPKIVELINNHSPDILFLGMPSPKKEEFIYRNRRNLNVGITIINGGMIDVLSGNHKQSPLLVKKLGLNLIYRFLQSPKNKYKQFFTYYFLILFYFVPIMLFRVKILRKKEFRLNDFQLLKRRIENYDCPQSYIK